MLNTSSAYSLAFGHILCNFRGKNSFSCFNTLNRLADLWLRHTQWFPIIYYKSTMLRTAKQGFHQTSCLHVHLLMCICNTGTKTLAFVERLSLQTGDMTVLGLSPFLFWGGGYLSNTHSSSHAHLHVKNASFSIGSICYIPMPELDEAFFFFL